MKNKFITTIIITLVLLNIGSFYLNYESVQQNNDLKSQISNLHLPVAIKGDAGYTPVKGIDYSDGKNGAAGINAISFNTTTIKEVPIIQQQTIQGVQAPELQGQFDPVTGNYEQKYSNDTTWEVVIPCTMFVSACPANATNFPAGVSGGLESN